MNKILIFGSAGMAGHVVYKYLYSLNKFEILNSAYKRKISEDTVLLDIRDLDRVRTFLEEINPDIVINCVGMLIEDSAERPDDAILINSYFPQYLCKLGRDLNYKLIHISTDCVFSGKKGDYKELDFRDGETMYARTKALGEIINDKDLTVRTSIIGPELKEKGEGLFHWFMNQSKDVNGYTKVLWSGLTTLELAKAIDSFIGQDISGLYHLVPNQKISKYELLCLIRKIWHRKDVTIHPDCQYISDKSLINNRKDFLFNVQGYQQMLEELYRWMQYHQDLYQHYRLRFLS